MAARYNPSIPPFVRLSTCVDLGGVGHRHRGLRGRRRGRGREGAPAAGAAGEAVGGGGVPVGGDWGRGDAVRADSGGNLALRREREGGDQRLLRCRFRGGERLSVVVMQMNVAVGGGGRGGGGVCAAAGGRLCGLPQHRRCRFRFVNGVLGYRRRVPWARHCGSTLRLPAPRVFRPPFSELDVPDIEI